MCVPSRLLPANEGETCEQCRDNGGECEPPEHSSPAPRRAGVAFVLSSPPLLEKDRFVAAQRKIRAARPILVLDQTARERQEFGIALCVLPLLDRLDQPPVED